MWTLYAEVKCKISAKGGILSFNLHFSFFMSQILISNIFIYTAFFFLFASNITTIEIEL